MKNKLRRNSLIFAFIGSVAVAALYWMGLFINFEDKSLDFRFKMRGVEKPQSPVVVAAMDDDSMARIGKPPWRRMVHAKLVDKLTKAGASAIVFDVLFYEPDNDRPQDDLAFARAIRKSKRTVCAYSFDYSEVPVSQVNEKGETVVVSISTVTKAEPVELIVGEAAAVGYVNSFPDPDGNLRRAHPVFWYEGEKYAALNLLAVSVAQNKSPDEIMQNVTTIDSVPGGWGYPGREVLVNYRGPKDGTFNTYSYADILEGFVPDEWLKGKIVLVGSTALGYFDHYNTPFQTQFPGVFFHANIIDNLWANDFLKPVSSWVTLLLIFLFGVVGSGMFVPRLSPWLGAVTALAGSALFWGFGYLLMTRKLFALELVAPIISLLGNYIVVFFYRFIIEQREKAGIKKAFGVYVNPHVVDQIAKNPDGLKLGGEMREMTVMFSDVAGFTSISEKLTPQELVHLLNLYLTAMTDTIMQYDGTVDKYEGDAIMAFWGAPLLQPQHAKQACIAVLENRERLKQLNADLEKQGINKLAARCGINSGPMNVGNMGSSQKFNYTVMGDAVNLASRLEGANKQYSTGLMVSETTREQAKDEIETRELDLLRVKGKKLPIKVFELVSKKGGLTDSQKKGFELYNEALDLYRKRNFKEALKKFQQVFDVLPNDGPSTTYIDRSKNYIESPPTEDWDGVFTMTTK